jgi:hypothetical protein
MALWISTEYRVIKAIIFIFRANVYEEKIKSCGILQKILTDRDSNEILKRRQVFNKKV